MATIPFTTWYDDVVPHVAGCPLPTVLQKIREAAIEFCRLSRAWRYLDLGPIDSVASQQTYVIGAAAALGALPADTALIHIFDARYNDQRLDVVTPQQLRDKSETWDEDEGDPEALTLFADGEISLWRIPSSGVVGAIVLPEVALAPTESASTIDERMYAQHRRAIALGARAYLHQIPDKPYTDLQLGRALEQDFIAAAGGADLRASSGRGHARLRTRTIYR